MSANTGTLKIKGERISFDSKLYGIWTIDMSRIAVIGEYTTEDGPFNDDHFVVIILNDGGYCEFPLSSDGWDLAITALRNQLMCGLKFSLFGSASFDSLVHYPGYLEGRPLFVFFKKRHGWLRRLINFNMEHKVTNEVADYIEKRRRETSDGVRL